MSTESPDDQTTAQRIRQVHHELTELKHDTGKRFDAVDRRFAAVDRRFDAVDQRFDQIERRLTETEVRLSTQIMGLQGTSNDVRDLLVERRPPPRTRPPRG